MRKLTKWDYIKAVTIICSFGLIVYCVFSLNVREADFYNRLMTTDKTKYTLLVMLILVGINFCLITNFKLKDKNMTLQAMYDTAAFMSLISLYFVVTNKEFQTVIFFALVILFFIALVVLRFVVLKAEFDIYKSYKHNPDRYIRLDEKESPLNKNYNYAQMELDRARNHSAFYEKKTVNAGDYFENAKSKKGVNGVKNQSFLNPHNNNYEKAFMEGQDNTNNVGVAFDFNPDPKNAKSAGRSMKDSITRNTTDVDQLNKDFIKTYNSKKGL